MQRWGKKLIVSTVALAAVFGFYQPAFAARIPNDTYFESQWYLEKIGAPNAWQSSLGFEGVIVAVIDSGIDVDHPDLKDNVWHNDDEIPGNRIDDDGNGYVDDIQGWDFVGQDNNPRPDEAGAAEWLSHGTVSAGVIAARGDNGIGISGVTWQTRIMPIRVIDGTGEADKLAVVRAVEYAVNNGASVINLSLSGSVRDELLAIALRRAYERGVFVVAAAGNSNDSTYGDLDRYMKYPACLDVDASENFVYTVAATDADDKRADFSNYGAGCVDLSAPGTRYISTTPARLSAQPYGGYFNGTSIASALVSGSVALIRAYDSRLTPKQVANLLMESATRIDSLNPSYFGKLGRGRLNLARALEILVSREQQTTPVIPTSALTPNGNVSGMLIAASGAGSQTELRLFTSDGILIRVWDAFSAGFRGGADLTVGNLDGNKSNSIIAAAGPGGLPQIRIFDVNTRLLGSFLAYDQRFEGGVSVSSGDLNGDDTDEIVTIPQSSGGSHVRIFTSRGIAIGGFFAFSEKLRTGWDIEVIDVDGDGNNDIVVAARDGSAVRVFSANGKLLADFKPLVSVKRGSEIRLVSTEETSGNTHLIALHYQTRTGERLASFSLSGELVSDTDIESAFAADDSLLLGSLSGRPPFIRVSNSRGEISQVQAFDRRFLGGVRADLIE